MELSQENILKFLIVGGLTAFILLLISFQFIFAIIVLIVAIVSFVLLRQNTQA